MIIGIERFPIDELFNFLLQDLMWKVFDLGNLAGAMTWFKRW